MPAEGGGSPPGGKGPPDPDRGTFDTEVPWSRDAEKVIEEAIKVLLQHDSIKTIMVAIVGEGGASKVEILTGERSDLRELYEAIKKAMGLSDEDEEPIN
jgi:hypothetical protein